MFIDDTIMISIITANNEVRAISNVAEIGKIVHEKNHVSYGCGADSRSYSDVRVCHKY